MLRIASTIYGEQPVITEYESGVKFIDDTTMTVVEITDLDEDTDQEELDRILSEVYNINLGDIDGFLHEGLTYSESSLNENVGKTVQRTLEEYAMDLQEAIDGQYYN